MVVNGERRKRARLPLHWPVRLIRLIRAEEPCAVETETTNLSSEGDRKSTRLNSSHIQKSRMPSSA